MHVNYMYKLSLLMICACSYVKKHRIEIGETILQTFTFEHNQSKL